MALGGPPGYRAALAKAHRPDISCIRPKRGFRLPARFLEAFFVSHQASSHVQRVGHAAKGVGRSLVNNQVIMEVFSG